MNEQDNQLTQEELEAQAGEPLPAREVMSVLSTNPGLAAFPEEPVPDPGPQPQGEPDTPPPGHDI